MSNRFAIAVCSLLALCPIVSNGQPWNLLNDFSATENPHGAWAFGWRSTATAPLNLYTDIAHDVGCTPDPNITVWNYQLYPVALVESPPVAHRLARGRGATSPKRQNRQRSSGGAAAVRCEGRWLHRAR